MERETRFELATSTLARLHSTTELFPLLILSALSPKKLCRYITKRTIDVNKKASMAMEKRTKKKLLGTPLPSYFLPLIIKRL